MAKRREPTAKASEISSKRDWISGLPNEVLTRILSFVPTAASVRTSVLSKRWYRLWTSVPNLDFFERSTNDGITRQACIDDFIDNFLSLHKVMSVHRIKLSCGGDYEISRVRAWIASVGGRDAKKIDLTLPFSCLRHSADIIPPICSLPDNFYVKSNLVKLELTYAVLKVPELVCFPNLEKVVLQSVQLFDENSVKNLLYGSPVLSTLHLFLDMWNNVQTLHICSSSLCQLLIHIESYQDSDYDAAIDCPNLTYLSIKDLGSSTYNMINVSSLVSAYICLEQDGKRLLKLLTQISHVKAFVLCYFSPSRLPQPSLAKLMFQNLVDLTVDIDFEESWEVLPDLFQCTPNLVSFALREMCWYSCDWYEPDEVPQCFLTSIKSVEIEWMREDHEDQMEFVSYILKNAMVLKKLSISHRWAIDSAQENKIRSTLLTLPKSSKICQIKVYPGLGP